MLIDDKRKIKNSVHFENNIENFSELKESVQAVKYQKKRNMDINESERWSFPILN